MSPVSAGEVHSEGGPGRFSALAEDECRGLLRTHTIGLICLSVDSTSGRIVAREDWCTQ